MYSATDLERNVGAPTWSPPPPPKTLTMLGGLKMKAFNVASMSPSMSSGLHTCCQMWTCWWVNRTVLACYTLWEHTLVNALPRFILCWRRETSVFFQAICIVFNQDISTEFQEGKDLKPSWILWVWSTGLCCLAQHCDYWKNAISCTISRNARKKPQCCARTPEYRAQESQGLVH